MKRILCSRRGEGYVDIAVSVLATMMLIVLAINVFSFFVIKQDMDYFAKEMIDAATVSGRTTGETDIRYSELSEETGLHPSYNWIADYYNATDQTVQLSDQIKITLSYRTYIKGFGVLKIPVTLKASYSGLSQKYWK